MADHHSRSKTTIAMADHHSRSKTTIAMADHHSRSAATNFSPSLISLSPFSSPLQSSSRRISCNFSKSSRPLPSISTKFAWISLQGRLIGAEEASSAVNIGGGLSPEEAIAWELFSPVHRVLIVTLIAVATARCQKNKRIRNLQRSLEVRDQMILCMQQKLENSCPSMNHSMVQPEIFKDIPLTESGETVSWAGNHRGMQSKCSLESDSSVTECIDVELFDAKLSNVLEHEERRMSNLSDWASSSVTSSAESQVAVEQYVFDNLKSECEEKEARIKELSTLLSASSTKKRIVELEDIVYRKNQIITRLEKDVIILEQKLVEMMRLHRSPPKMEGGKVRKLPFMADNVIYGMDYYTTTSSSSDSDCGPAKQAALVPGRENYKVAQGSTNKSRPFNHDGRKPSSRKPAPPRPRSGQASPVKERPAIIQQLGTTRISSRKIKRWV